VGRALHTFFSSLCGATLKPIDDRHRRQAMQEEFDRIEQALETELPTLGRSVAFFVYQKLSLWRQIAVSVALPDGVFVRPTPYLRPLARTRDEHDRFVLALLSQELSRFFISQIGQVEEAFQIKANRPRKVLMDGGPKDRPHVMATEPLMNEARLLAHAEELVLTQFEGRHLLHWAGWNCVPPSCSISRRRCGNMLPANSLSRSKRRLRRSQPRPSPLSARSRLAKKSRPSSGWSISVLGGLPGASSRPSTRFEKGGL
jgi:hypothetical protein